MNASNLIKILQGLDPECVVNFSLGDNDEYREKCAKVQLTNGECLDYLGIKDVVIGEAPYDNSIWVDIHLEQWNYEDKKLDEWAEKFDEEYKKVSDENDPF